VDQAMFEIGAQILVGLEDRESWARVERIDLLR
jgi:hypothetical protein